MAKIKIKTVDIQRTKNNASINLKGYSTVSIKTSESSDFLNVVTDVSVSGSTLKVTISDKTLNFTNVNPDMFIQAVDTTGTVYYGSGNSIDIKTFFSEEKKISYNKIDCSNVSTKVTGSILSDEIDLSGRKDLTKIVKVGKKKVSMPKESTDAGFSVNAGFGDDVITGSMYSDTITGGAGENKVVVNKAEDFGNDTIKLTNGEKLTIDLTDYEFESAEDVIGDLKISKNDLLLELDNGTVKLANFAKTNGVGADGSVKLLLSGTLGESNEVSVNLNTDNLFEYTTGDFKPYYKKIKGEKVLYAAKFTGNRFGEEFTIPSNEDLSSEFDDVKVLDTVTKTINMGEGNNTVNIEGSGKNTVVCGSGSDTININENDAITTIKTGKGENTINITDSNFGTVTLAEEKVGAKNIINFADGIIDNYTFTKSGNDLIINNGDSNKLTLTGYYVERTTRNKYSDIRFKLAGDKTTYTVDELLKNKDKVVTITGKGKIIGTDCNDEISGNKGADKIYTGAGTDTIMAGKGNDTVIINGVGNKTIEIGRDGGNDTIAFDLKNVEIGYQKMAVNLVFGDESEEPTTEYSVAPNQQDLIIINKYPKSDSGKAVTQKIMVKDYFNNIDKIDLFVGEGDDKIDVYEELKKSNDEEVEGTKGSPFDDKITGTDRNDIIYGYAGNDTIYATKGNDKIYGGNGDDRYVYQDFARDGVNLGHDTIYNSNGSDTISIAGLNKFDMQNYFEPSIINQTYRVYPSYIRNSFDSSANWIKNGNDLILSAKEEWKNSNVNTITLKDYFKAGKDGFGVKYMDNNLKDKIYCQSINILDNARLVFDEYTTPRYIKSYAKNNFTGTFMNDIISGSPYADTLHGGDGNDVIYGSHANGPDKNKLYGDEGNDIIFGSDSYMHGGSGNDIFVPSNNEGVNIISDESGYDRISFMQGNYLTYFDVSLKGDDGYEIGKDIYIKNITNDLTIKPIREVKNGELDKRFVDGAVFEVSEEYYNRLVGENGDITLLQKMDDYGEDKKYLDGWALVNYEPKSGYKLVYTSGLMYVLDNEYTYKGFKTESIFDTNSKINIYDKRNISEDKLVGESGDNKLYDLTPTEKKSLDIKTILNSDSGVVIKNGTDEKTAIETIMFDRECNDEENICGSEDTLKIGDYNHENIVKTAEKVANWLRTYKTNKFSSVQEVIAKGNDEDLKNMFECFKNVYNWTDGVKYRSGGYIEDEIIKGTAILEDNTIITDEDYWDNTHYKLTLKNENGTKARMSMISDYTGAEDELILDFNGKGYSFLFDVEIDNDGKLQNYSRDFYVKFKGEEGENTGVVICNGREERHAIETIKMVNGLSEFNTSEINDSEILFSYDQDTIDAVRQNVAGWLATTDYTSVQEVLHCGETDVIAEMMTKFAPINNPNEQLV